MIKDAHSKEEWRQYLKGLYYISDNGKVWSVRRKKLLKPGNRPNGYGFVVLYGNKKETKSIHRLVAETFIPNPENKPQVNHKNGIKTDNRVENLEWVTISENERHAHKLGLKCQKGEENNSSKLNEWQVRIIRRMNGNMYRKYIAEYFGVSTALVNLIIGGKTWKHL